MSALTSDSFDAILYSSELFYADLSESKKNRIGQIQWQLVRSLEAEYADKTLTAIDTLPDFNKMERNIKISGKVFLKDGKTPAKDVIVYVYHTNVKGVYPKRGNEKGNDKYHGYLRGWMKTDANGKYEFETIRPAPYNTHEGEPAHIHYTLEGPGYPEYWLTGLWFSDDPRVGAYEKKIERSGGFSNIVTLTKDENNVLRGRRNIRLEKFKN